jgi:hypothetical protein
MLLTFAVLCLLQEPIMNAFVFPGGYIVVYTGAVHKGDKASSMVVASHTPASGEMSGKCTGAVYQIVPPVNCLVNRTHLFGTKYQAFRDEGGG